MLTSWALESIKKDDCVRIQHIAKKNNGLFYTEIKEKKLEPGKHDGKSILFCFILSIPQTPSYN